MSGKVYRDHHRWTKTVSSTGDRDINISGDLTFDVKGGQLTIRDTSADFLDPDLIIKGEQNSAAGYPSLQLENYRDGGSGGDGDILGQISYFGYNDNTDREEYAGIYGYAVDVTDGDERGKLSLFCRTNVAGGSNIKEALKLEGSTTDDVVNVNIGSGATSTTTIAGDLDIDGDTITSAGNLSITPTGDFTITPGGNDINFSATNNVNITASGGVADPTIQFAGTHNGADGPIIKFLHIPTDGSEAAQDKLGRVRFSGYNDASEVTDYAEIEGSPSNVTDGGEIGILKMKVCTENASSNRLIEGLKLTGSSTNDEVDVWIGSGTGSMTTLAGDLDLDGSSITIAGDSSIKGGGILKLDCTTITESNGIQFLLGTTHVGNITGHSSATQLRLYENIGATTNDYFNIAVAAGGATTISTVDAGGHAGDINISPDGDVNFDCNGHVEFDGCGVGFDLETCSYDATNTLVDFRTGNKQMLTFDGGNITNLFIYFPNTSGNFTLLVKQDGSGSRTISYWKAYDSAGVAADGSSTVKFAGGSNPDLTDDANHVDIVSFFWDADTEIAYGVATLDFQF